MKTALGSWSGTDEKQKEAAIQRGGPGPKVQDNCAQGRMLNNHQHLRNLRAIFQEAEKDGRGALDMDEFRETMKKIMEDAEDEDLDIIFMKVDTNCDGTVDWDEFRDYMLLESREKDSLQTQNIYFPNPLNTTLMQRPSKFGVLYGAVDDTDALNMPKTSHENTVCAALYNGNFKQVVSGCYNGFVCTWDILTGAKVMQFQTSPKKPVEITVMTFDGSKRRLITGSQDGTVRLWNFNNGALLQTLPLLDKNEVTSILYINQRIYVSGWNKRVISFLDIKKDDEMEFRIWNQYHTEDIYSMHAHANKMLVTASYSGDIIIWNIDSGRAFCRFNARESSGPLLPNRVLTSACEMPEGSQTPSTFERDLLRDSTQVKEDPGPACPSSSSSSSSDMELNANRVKHSITPPYHHRTPLPDINPWSAEMLEEMLEEPKHAVQKALFLTTRECSPNTATLLTCVADGYIYAWSIHHQGGLLGKFRAVYTEEDFVTTMSTDPQDQILLTGDSKGYVTLWDIEGYCCSVRGEQEPHSECPIHLRTLIPKYCQIEGKRKMALESEHEVRDGCGVSLAPPPLLSSWRCHLKAITSLEYVEHLRLIFTASLDRNVRVWTFAGCYVGTFGCAPWSLGDPDEDRSELPRDLRRVASYQTLKVLNKGRKPHWNYVKRIMRPITNQHQQTTATSKEDGLLLTDPRIAVDTTEQIEATWRQWEETGKHLCMYKALPLYDLEPVSLSPLPEWLRNRKEGTDHQEKPKPNCRQAPRVHFPTLAKGGRTKVVGSSKTRGGV
ncbi:WD repeat-containing protein on Y chromosome-like isoform X2 [Brachyhypopomus gauderio]|uniref:WD repeat-containing protein on Y chromosome-like isoform X2 n=1 Tax=Brachyhypopomus gauderio TaxID=698409 RepID=UPI004042E0FC